MSPSCDKVINMLSTSVHLCFIFGAVASGTQVRRPSLIALTGLGAYRAVVGGSDEKGSVGFGARRGVPPFACFSRGQ